MRNVTLISGPGKAACWRAKESASAATSLVRYALKALRAVAVIKVLTVAMLALLLPATSALAAPIYMVIAEAGGASDSMTTDGGSASAGASFRDDEAKGVSQGSAAAFLNTQRMSVRANAGIEPVFFEFFPGQFGFGRLTASAGASAFFRFNDVIFTSDVMQAGNIMVSTRLSVDGVLNAGISLGLSSASISLDYGLGVPGSGSTAVVETIGAVSRRYNSGNLTTSAIGVFSDLDANDTAGFDIFVDTPSFSVPLNTPLSLALRFQASASVTTQEGDAVSAFSDFSQTLNIGYNGLIFNLPNDVTASSASAGITNNRFDTFGPAAIPVPAAWPLMLSGLGMLFGVGRIGAKSKHTRIELAPRAA